jgi:hypothetical protein
VAAARVGVVTSTLKSGWGRKGTTGMDKMGRVGLMPPMRALVESWSVSGLDLEAVGGIAVAVERVLHSNYGVSGRACSKNVDEDGNVREFSTSGLLLQVAAEVQDVVGQMPQEKLGKGGLTGGKK